ncbi:MAG TPA: MBL fold metallo-hydrolase, partial [Acidimicrobiales bacterium]|nr:MBL fold metallo-hydrolase [Acidimicrobiales bacterium]
MTERNDATEATAAANAAVAASLPLADEADFERARRGLLAEAPAQAGAAGLPVWDRDRYAFVEGDAPDSVNPSLWRQARLNGIAGLFEVCDGFYQVRGLDLSNITFIRGETGWVVIDPLTAAETASAALALANEHLGERPVVAVIYTHSHVDHFGGVRGVVDEADVTAGKVPILAPEGFLHAAISENVIAGNVMQRRASHMYGPLLPPPPPRH